MRLSTEFLTYWHALVTDKQGNTRAAYECLKTDWLECKDIPGYEARSAWPRMPRGWSLANLRRHTPALGLVSFDKSTGVVDVHLVKQPQDSLGYIVRNETTGLVVALLMRDNSHWKHVPEGGILLAGNTATVFTTRLLALQAITRTMAYMAQHNQTNPGPYEFSLLRLVPQPDSEV